MELTSVFLNEHKYMSIPDEIIEELKNISVGEAIPDPLRIFSVAFISYCTAQVIGSKSRGVYISRRALKHIIDSRGNKADEVISIIPVVLNMPEKIVNNFLKRDNSFILTRKISRNYGVVLEITKTPGSENQVVSAFIIDPRTYEKMYDISGGTAP